MKKHMTILMVIVLLCSNIFGRSIFTVMAEEPELPKTTTYYKSIMIESGDSLWTIANEYIENTNMSHQEYIHHLKMMNNLKEDTIHAGQHLTVMYLVAAE